MEFSTDIIISLFETLGIPVGGMLVITYLLLQDRTINKEERDAHRKERREWLTRTEAMQERNISALDLLRESNERMQDRNIDALTEWKTSNVIEQKENRHALEVLTTAIKNSK